jgi:microcin C transport system ATP-binding protein
MSVSSPLISIDRLSVVFGHGTEASQVVHEVSFDIAAGEKLALVGESGSGKSVTALSILGLHDRSQTRYPSGSIMFGDRDLLTLGEDKLRSVRGADIAMIFQEPMTALNPVYPVGKQLIEPLVVHRGMSKQAARERMIELLDRTGIKEPHKRIDAYPHMLSGGQRQRVMIAMALACNPRLLVADEPTTALDVTIQVQILELLEDLQQEFGMAILMITHDLNMVRRFAERVCVMQEGRLVETAPIRQLFENPQHSYTKQLLNSQPRRIVKSVPESEMALRPTVVESDSLRCYFPIKSGFFQRKIGEVKAVDNVSLQLRRGETLGIVGESGSGKTTLGMCLLRLQQCDGDIRFKGESVQQLANREMRPLRRHIQVVFQDPFSSLSPRMTIEKILSEGLRIHYPELDVETRRKKIVDVLHEVDLEEDMLWRYPHEFSGGQRQRIAIARAVVLEPDLVLLDEPTSALDVSVQKQVLDLLVRLQEKHGMAYLFITHDLNVIQAISHRVIVMRSGQVVERGETETLFASPQDDYTRTLLRASLFSTH